ncbi:MAG: Holliday junction branch migration DNA helicase RuvB [Candidatus Liptonbacteria bacterium CG11_big_fil_rev_8_21_14_0_20_35_14]|uniref:Holliday junction branch migration complex subunit RuvB n=1 Tax=Candidatus Liptonbacteria bacterium CG11_big_fil_rev_8_21_14_0_20_35_14 TaxID=1974634 RepID=A0A2H0NA80_9BACT|nr:MAG: Holliday junction branch migration DNA helicase RuvB [Candidatus Liptonbacteria bacterium CG11_big_fil_rev_8_21_14_0_20_35_14]
MEDILGKEGNNFLEFDQALRPDSFEAYIGQEKVKENLAIIIEAAQGRGESIDHILLHGQAGLGKTTLALIMAKALAVPIRVASGPTLKKVGDLAAILSNLEPNTILFIDEAHRLNRMVEEFLYPAMESRKLHLIIGKGPGARTLSLDLPPFTLIAATTRADLLSSPLRSRFGATFKLDFYNNEDIKEIIRRSAKLLGVEVQSLAVEVLAKSSRATPRVANRLLKRARDYAQVKSNGVIDEEVALKTLKLLEVDEIGLENHDREFLRIIVETFNRGPVGIETLAAALCEERSVIEDVYEPYLMRVGFLKRTSAGRVVTEAALAHLNIKTKEQRMLDDYLK